MSWTSRVISKLTNLDDWINSLSVDNRVGLSSMLGGTSGAAASLSQVPFLGDTPKHVAIAAVLVGTLASIGIGALAALALGGGVLVSTVVGFVGGILISAASIDVALASAFGITYIAEEIGNFFGDVWGGQGSSVAIEGNDVQHFGYGADSVFAVDNAKIYGEWGDDYLVAHDNAEAFGGDGDDTLRGTSHAHVHGDDGNDNITVFENAIGYGGTQNDELYALGNAKIFGEGGEDILSSGDYTIADGGADNDFIYVRDHARGYGGAGEDKLFAESSAQVFGGGDDDTIDVNGMAAYGFGENGDDRLFARGGGYVAGGIGDDEIVVKDSSWGFGGAGSDKLTASDGAHAIGDEGDDYLFGYDWSKVHGGTEDDWIFHYGFGEAHGDAGDDLLVAWFPNYLTQGEYLRAEDRAQAEANQSLPPEDQVPIDGPVAESEMVLRMYGGADNDWLMAVGGDAVILDGGDGSDLLVGWSGEDHLYGNSGEGASDNEEDWYFISHRTFIHNAGVEDHVFLGPFVATGGVRTWWMEGQFAYNMPFLGLFSAMPTVALPAVGALAPVVAVGAAVDVVSSLMFRYAISTSGQLVIQSFMGAMQSVVEDYELDLETGVGTAGIAVYQQRLVEGFTLAEVRKTLNLALKAGFGVGLDGEDPLILDLDGDGYDLVRRDAAGVYFDLDGDNFAERTAWVAPDDGFLVRDLNGNGVIDDITEMFGTAATPGLTMLAALDSNGDGRITSADTDFAMLKVWRDLDGDGETDDGELQTLGEAGITEISLTSSTPSTSVVRGNAIRAESTFTRTNGTTSKIGDVLLQTDEADTVHLGDNTISTTAAALPELKGYGELTSLRVAMTDDATLLSLVDTMNAGTAATSWADIKQATDDILFRWAGVEGVAADLIGSTTLDTRELAFLEKYFGRDLVQFNAQGQIIAGNLAEVEALWEQVLEATAIRLAAQGPWASLFTEATYVDAVDTFAATSATTLSSVYSAVLGQLSGDPATAEQEWNSNWGPALSLFSGSLIRSDYNAVRTDFVVMSLVQALASTTSPLTLHQLVDGLALEGVHIGTSGDDTLARAGDVRTQVYVGDSGNDTMTGGIGQDVFVFGSDFGQDTIVDTEFTPSGDRIRLATLNAGDVQIERVGVDLVITVIATGDKITVQGQYTEIVPNGYNSVQQPGFGIEDIQFADGTIWEAGEIAMAVGTGSSASETIEGSQREDILRGSGGDDILLGGDSGDIYWYEDGDGNDVIHDVRTSPYILGGDVLFINGTPTANSISVSRDGDSDDVVLTLDDGSTITIQDQFTYSPIGYGKYELDSRMEAIFFNDGPSWDWQELQRQVLATYTTDGADFTYGFGTPDEIFSSAGDDFLSGLDGGDVYHFDLGTGNDTIYDASKYISTPFSGVVGTVAVGVDVVQFGEGIDRADIQFTRAGADPDLVITNTVSGDTLTIIDQFDGMSADIFGILGTSIWLDRIEEFRFADGTALSWSDVMDIVTAGGAGDDLLYGSYSIDTLDGKAGNDYLSGQELPDTYIFDVGYGVDTIEDRNGNPLSNAPDRIKFGASIAPTDVTFIREGVRTIPQDLRISINGTSDAILIKSQYDVTETGPFGAHALDEIELFEFFDGTILSWPDIAAQMIADAATAGDDTVYGTHYDDTIAGAAGDDILMGWNGSDTYLINQGDGNDTVNDGRDTIFGGDFDQIVFGAGLTTTNLAMTRSGSTDQLFDLHMTFGTQTTTIEGQFYYDNLGFTPTRIEQFVFGDGTVWTAAQLRQEYLLRSTTSGDDTIEGFVSDDLLSGGTGNDTLRGGDGSDTYMFALGDGQDRIEETLFEVFYDDHDVIEFGAGILPSNVILSRPAGTDDLIISVAGTADTIAVADQFKSAAGYGSWTDIEAMRFADGTEWSAAAIRQQLLDQQSTSGNDTIIGFYTADTIDGGAGNDLLKGSAGSDTYLFGVGSGHDVIEEALDLNHPFIAGTDTIEFVGSLVSSDVNSTRVGMILRSPSPQPVNQSRSRTTSPICTAVLRLSNSLTVQS